MDSLPVSDSEGTVNEGGAGSLSVQSRDQLLLVPVIQNPMLGPVGSCWRGDDICAWTALKTGKSSHQHIFSIKLTVLVSVCIFKDLNRAREKGIQGERKCSENTVVIQKVGVIREG